MPSGPRSRPWRRQNAQLERELDYLQSDAYVAVEARKLLNLGLLGRTAADHSAGQRGAGAAGAAAARRPSRCCSSGSTCSSDPSLRVTGSSGDATATARAVATVCSAGAGHRPRPAMYGTALMQVPQFGIFAQGTIAHEFIEFDLRPDVEMGGATAALGRLRAPAVSAGGVNLVIGFGGELWRDRRARPGAGRPRQLHAHRRGSAATTRRPPSTTSGSGSAARRRTSSSSTRGPRSRCSPRSRRRPPSSRASCTATAAT